MSCEAKLDDYQVIKVDAIRSACDTVRPCALFQIAERAEIAGGEFTYLSRVHFAATNVQQANAILTFRTNRYTITRASQHEAERAEEILVWRYRQGREKRRMFAINEHKR
jgi:hypothetical protein